MLKFGAITIDVSHPSAFAAKLAEGERGRYTAVYNDSFRSEEEVKEFSEKFGVKICSSLEELAESVDIGMIHGCNWDRHLSYIEPFIKLGKPVFIDKPLVGNLAECRKLLEYSKNGAKIIGSSCLRYAEEVAEVKAALKEKNAHVLHVDATVGTDDFNYAIHAIEEICTLIEAKPESARHIGTSVCETETCDNYFIKFNNGATACLQNYGKRHVFFNTVVLTSGDTPNDDFCFRLNPGKAYGRMLETVCDYLEGKPNESPSVETLLDPIMVALACKASKMNGGAEISVYDEILENISFDGYEFERGYSAAAIAARKAALQK